MKKTLRTILAGAVALLAVSCYDDSELRGEVEKLDERVTALEAKLNAAKSMLFSIPTALYGSRRNLSACAVPDKASIASAGFKVDMSLYSSRGSSGFNSDVLIIITGAPLIGSFRLFPVSTKAVSSMLFPKHEICTLCVSDMFFPVRRNTTTIMTRDIRKDSANDLSPGGEKTPLLPKLTA